MDGYDLHDLTAQVGADDLEEDGKPLPFALRVVHERWNYVSADYDFALLELTGELSFGERIQTVQLPKIDDIDPDVGTMVLVSGWGETRNETESERYLRAVELPIVDQELCNKVYNRVTKRMFCAGFYEEGGKSGQCLMLTGRFG